MFVPISATEIEPARGPWADSESDEELIALPFGPPIASQPEIVTADTPTDTVDSSDTPNVDAPEEVSRVVEPVIETEPTSALAPAPAEAREPEPFEEHQAPATAPTEEPATDAAPGKTTSVPNAAPKAEVEVGGTSTPAVASKEEKPAVARLPPRHGRSSEKGPPPPPPE